MSLPDPTDHRLFQLINGFRASQLLAAAVALGVPDMVSERPMLADDLAATMGTHAPSLRRALRGLAALGVLEETADGHFGATAMSKRLEQGAPNSLAPMALALSQDIYAAWGDLPYSLRTGTSAYRHMFGMSHFESLAKDPEAAALFNRFMSATAFATAAALVEAYAFPTDGTVVDIGGGVGTTLAAVLRANPRLTGVLFDLPAGLREAPAYLAEQGVADRCRLVEGSFLEQVPAGDIYLVQRILHDWGDEEATVILESCRRAMSPDARLLVIEMLLPDHTRAEPYAERVHMLDLHMLVTLGGRERSEDEYAALFDQAGLRHQRTIRTSGPSSVIEARPI